MRKLRLLLTVTVAVLSLLATTSAAVAKERKAAKPVAAAAPAEKPSTDVQQRITKPGDFRYSIEHGGLARTYRVHVPRHYNAAEPAPAAATRANRRSTTSASSSRW